MAKKLQRYALIIFAAFIMAVGNYFFMFPNRFCFGGVNGLSSLVSQISPITASTFNAAANLLLLIIAFLLLGRQFAMTTALASVTISISLVVFERLFPLTSPLTDQPMLEFVLAVALPSLSSALLFHFGASAGGTDIPAMMLKKYAHVQNIGVALFWIDLVMVIVSLFVLNLRAILFSAVGLAVKTFLIDDIIENITLCKSVMVICKDADQMCDYIIHTLKRGATISQGKGAYTGTDQSIVFTTLTRRQAKQLRLYIRQNSLQAFITMSNTIEVFGEGFANV